MVSRSAYGVCRFNTYFSATYSQLLTLVNPYISQHSPIFEEARQQGYLIKRSNGQVWQWDLWQPGLGIFDVTNPAAREWYSAMLHKLLDLGVDCFKVCFVWINCFIVLIKQ